jgi:phosphatidylglycerophosphate synthase
VSFLGKLSAWVLYAGVLAIVVTRSGTDWPLWIFWTGVALDLASGAHYVWAAWQSKHARSDRIRPRTSL